jgi:tetratricopeptide (TPR) repeat protein
MKIRSSAALALVLGLGVALAGCGKMNEVRAMKAFKDGNKLYQANDYRAAAAKYEEAIQMDPNDNINSCGGSPGCVYFYLGNSYDNVYRPTRKGEPNNDALLDKAIANYKLAAEKITNDPKMRTLALQYLVAAYGPEKLNDPTQAEPVVQDMIKLEPNEPTNYFVLAQIYSDSGEYELAEQT